MTGVRSVGQMSSRTHSRSVLDQLAHPVAQTGLDRVKPIVEKMDREVEAVLNEHPAVVQSAVIGRPVPGNEEVVAFVQLLPDSAATSADLMAHAARQLTPYKRPSEIIVLEALPAGSTGKILKHRLAETARHQATEPT